MSYQRSEEELSALMSYARQKVRSTEMRRWDRERWETIERVRDLQAIGCGTDPFNGHPMELEGGRPGGKTSIPMTCSGFFCGGG